MRTCFSFLVAVSVAALLLDCESASAQQTCFFHPVGPPLTDLGAAEYYRLTGSQGSSPGTWTYVVQPGVTGGLYPGGTNVRPSGHEAAGLALASMIQLLDADGRPSEAGKIGLASIGMSNTRHEFGRFIQRAAADPSFNDKVIFVNGAVGGGVVETWTDTSNTSVYQTYWTSFYSKIAAANLTPLQVQVVWAEVASLELNTRPFPDGTHVLEGLVALLAMELRARLPNLKILYLSTRTRAFNYFAGEPVGLENGFAVKWLIERQINGDPSLNYDPSVGTAPVPYLAWGPYLWIDGTNPRSDGRTWPLTYTGSDCLHPSTEGYEAVADMLLEFFRSDTTARSWFLTDGSPPPPPPPPPPDTTAPTISNLSVSGISSSSATVNWTTNEPATGQVEFLDVCPPAGCFTPLVTTLASSHAIGVTDLSASTTYRCRVRSADAAGNLVVSDELVFETPSPPPPPPPGGAAISSWGFGTSSVADDVSGCTGCANVGATWNESGIFSGSFQFNGAAYLNLGAFPHLNSRQAFTISVWVRPDFDSASSSSRYLFTDGNNVSLYYLGQSRSWRVNVRTTTGSVRVSSPVISWAAGTWHQLAVSYSGTELKLYWDGVLVASAAAGGGAVEADSGATYLGTSAARSYSFIGSIDELRIYDHVRSDLELYASYLDPGR